MYFYVIILASVRENVQDIYICSSDTRNQAILAHLARSIPKFSERGSRYHIWH